METDIKNLKQKINRKETELSKLKSELCKLEEKELIPQLIEKYVGKYFICTRTNIFKDFIYITKIDNSKQCRGNKITYFDTDGKSMFCKNNESEFLKYLTTEITREEFLEQLGNYKEMFGHDIEKNYE